MSECPWACISCFKWKVTARLFDNVYINMWNAQRGKGLCGATQSRLWKFCDLTRTAGMIIYSRLKHSFIIVRLNVKAVFKIWYKEQLMIKLFELAVLLVDPIIWLHRTHCKEYAIQYITLTVNFTLSNINDIYFGVGKSNEKWWLTVRSLLHVNIGGIITTVIFSRCLHILNITLGFCTWNVFFFFFLL